MNTLLEEPFKTLKSQLRKLKTLVNLNRFVKETGEVIKPQAAAMREYVNKWLESGAQLNIPALMESVAVLRAIAQWVILFASECDGQGFPFALSHIKLFDRCSNAFNSLSNLIGNGCFHPKATKYAKRLM